MNKTIFLVWAGVLCGAASFGSTRQVPPGGFLIKGNIKGIKTGVARLNEYHPADRTSKTVDSVAIVNGSFVFKGKKDVPDRMSIMIEPGNFTMPVFVENSSIVINADTTGSMYYDYTSYGMSKFANLSKYSITGSANENDYKSFSEDPQSKVFGKRYDDLISIMKTEKDSVKKSAVSRQINVLRKERSDWERKWIGAFIARKPASPAGTALLHQYFIMNSETPLGAMDSMLNKFTAPANKTVYYKELVKTADARKAMLPGHIAPDFTLRKRDSSFFTLSSARGKYIMIDFWASWCHPCREAIPHWKKVYEKYHSKGFDIISVSDDSRWNAWTKALDEEKMPWATQVIDEFPIKNMPARVGTIYQTHYIPFYVLLDKEGKIILCNPTEMEMDTKLKELLD